MTSRAPQALEWHEVIDALHALTNTMTVRTHYPEGHPAIARADDLAATSFTRVLERTPELLVAFVDDEFVISERPLPELRERLHVLAGAMSRHEIECIVFHRGMTKAECEVLGRMLSLAADVPGRVRAQAQASLAHVLLRFLEARADGVTRWSAGVDATNLVPAVRDLLGDVTLAIIAEEEIDAKAVTALARRLVGVAATRAFTLEQRSLVDGRDDDAVHATNVALMTAAMALDARLVDEICVDVTAAALLHDIGRAFAPKPIRGVPEPLLDEATRPQHHDHAIAGASALLLGGCPDLWIAAALEHHRGVDGLGYPTLVSKEPPHELVRMIALASFVDRKRTLLDRGGRGARDQGLLAPDDALRLAASLEECYFGKPLLRRFLRALGAFPPGTTVELSNRAPAIVTQANAGDPLRPQVQLLRGPDTGKRVELRDLDAVQVRFELSIVRAIAPPLFVPGDIVAKSEAAEKAKAEDAPPHERAAAASVRPRAERTRRLDADGVATELLATPPPPPEPPPPEPPPAPSRASKKPSTPPPSRIPRTDDAPAPKPSRIPRTDDAPASTRGEQVNAQLLAFLSDAPPPPVASKPPPVASKPPPVASKPPPVASKPPPVASVPPIVASKPPPVSISMKPEPTMPSARPPATSSRPPAGPVPICIASAAAIAEEKGLDPRAGFVLTFVDGSSTLDEVIDACGLPKEVVSTILEDLLGRGILAFK